MIWIIIEFAYKISPFLVILLTGMVSLAFARILFSTRGIIHDLALGFLILYMMVLARTVYWDVLAVYLPWPTWQSWIAITRGISFNLIFNTMVALASLYSLKAVHRSIPPSERPNYSLLTAFLYPRSLPSLKRLFGRQRS